VRVALVTGASSGIGEATARRLDRDGWRLILVARRADRLDALAGELSDAHPLAVDLTDRDAPPQVRARVEDEGELELLVNNAGVAGRGAFADTGYEEVRRTMDVNFDAVVRLTEALLPVLRRSSPSAVVNVSSTAGRVGRARAGAYCASKFALAGWTESLWMEEAEHGVHVANVLPGFVRTEGFPQTTLVKNPWTRWAVSKPEKVADAIVDAASGKPERYVPRAYGLGAALHGLAPGLVRRVMRRTGL
jgi:uncharacterized protein